MVLGSPKAPKPAAMFLLSVFTAPISFAVSDEDLLSFSLPKGSVAASGFPGIPHH
jgi:hypothetical protein